MPKLTKTMAQKAKRAAADWGDGFEPLKPGRYLGKLVSVEQKDGQVAPYWEWKWQEPTSKNHLWENTSLSENAIGRLGKVFEAYGVPDDTDTDELIGKWVGLLVGVRTRPTGERAGELQNTVNGFFPAVEHPDYEALTGKPAAKDADYGAADEDEPADEAPAPSVDWEAIGNAANLDDEGTEAALLMAIGAILEIDDTQYTWPDFAVAIGEAVEAVEDEDVLASIHEALDEHLGAVTGANVGDEEPF